MINTIDTLMALAYKIRDARTYEWDVSDVVDAGSALRVALTEALAQPVRDDEFATRGELAARLKCWHRLTREESDELVDLLRAQGPSPWPDDVPEVHYERGYGVALSDAEEAIADECRERAVTASDCIELIRNLGAEPQPSQLEQRTSSCTLCGHCAATGKTYEEKMAYAAGWWKALEANGTQPVQVPLTSSRLSELALMASSQGLISGSTNWAAFMLHGIGGDK